MLAQVLRPSADFHTWVRQIMALEQHPDPDYRPHWVITHNLALTDCRRAVKLMRATAAMSVRCRFPAYRFTIAWHDDERPTPDIMQEVALRTLDLLGLSDHQAILVARGDTLHPCVQLLVNRVDPMTRTAWPTSRDFERLEEIMRQLARAYGFRVVPSRRMATDDHG